MTYGYYGAKGSRKQSKTKTLEVRRILASLTMAAGILASPFSVGEAAIVRRDETTISPTNNVYNIDPEGKNSTGDFAYNRFKEFGLEQGQIANLKFDTASTLANLVNNRVTINGIVNAVKGGAIDGHLIFLSPNGIAVGSSGVINAGQFTGIVPTPEAFNKLYNTQTPATDITLAAINQIKDGAYAAVKTDDEGVVQGTIDISGQINTHSGVMLGAGIINIKDGAKIQSTKDVSFTDVVNTGSTGLSFATSVTGGDIILMAKQESTVKDDTPIHWRDRSTDLSAAVNIGKNVAIASSDGAVTLTAESKSTYEDSTPMTLTDTLKGMIFGEDSALEGTIGKLTAKEGAENTYLFVNYSNKRNKSSVNIGENSAVSGRNIEIAATSKVDITQSVSVPGEANPKDSNGQAMSGNSAAVAAVAISRVYNTADVVIDGNLTAAGAEGIKIAANADTKASLSASGYNANNTAVAAGVAILAGDTKAKVTVNVPASAQPLTATQGKVSVEADTKSDIYINADTVGNAGYAVSNVGVANYDTSADVSINRSITAGAVDVNAANNITGLKMTVGNMANETPGRSKNTAGANDDDDADANEEKEKVKTGDEQKSGQKSIDPAKVTQEAFTDTTNDEKTKDAKDGVRKVKDKVVGANESGANAGQISAFGRGAAVGVVSNKNDANVTLGKDAVITATKVSDAVDGSVHVNAYSLMNGQDSMRLSVQNRQSGSNAEIGAAVLVSSVKNNATVLLENEGDQSAKISGAGAVSLNASAGMGKYKVDGGKEKTSVLAYSAGAENQSEWYLSGNSLSGSVGVNTLKNNAIVLLGQKSKVAGADIKLSSNATTSAEGTYGAADEDAKVGLGATVGLQNISGNSMVMAGKGVELTGASKVAVSVNNTVDLKNNVQNAGRGDSFGISGMAALSYGDSNSVVSLDDEAVIQSPTVRLTSMNSTNVDNSARSQSKGSESSKAFGIGVGVVNYDVNSIAMVGDNGSGNRAPSDETTDEEKANQKIFQDAALARNIAGDALAGKLGAATTDDVKGSITAERLSVSAITMGLLQNDAKAKAVSSAAADARENVNERKDSEKWSQWSEKGTEGAKEAKANTEQMEQDKVASQNDGAAPNASQSAQEAGNAANPDEAPKNDGAAPASGSSKSAGTSIGVEGSVALTFLGGRTDAVLDNVMVKNVAAADVKSVSLAATDILGSVTFGGTVAKNTLRSDSSATKVGIGGTFAMNDSARDVDSLLRNSDIQQVKSVSNSATKTGIEAAAGMGVSASKGNGTNIFGAGVVYYNRAKQDVHALMINNTVTGGSDGAGTLTNKAKGTDYQIAGGLEANFAYGNSTNVGAGGAVAVSNLENNLSSGIIGGSYQKFLLVNVETQKKTAQLNGALAATYAGGDSGYGFEGALAYTSAKNTTHAYISGASIDGPQASAVNVKAGEGSVLKTDEERIEEKNAIESDESFDENTKSLLKDAADADKKNKELLEEKGIDTTGKSYLDTTEAKSALDETSKDTDGGKSADEAAHDENTAKRALDANKSCTVTAAMAGGWNGKAGVGSGIAYNYVKNDIAADIKNSVIQADTINGEAAGESLVVSVGAGAAVGGKAFNGAGSGSWNDLKNDTKVTFENNTITGKTISEKAESNASILNIAGEVAGGRGMALGLSLAYNSLDNTTGTYLTGNTVNLSDAASLALASANKGTSLAVAAGVDVEASKSVEGAVGTVAINRGRSNTESVIDGKKVGNTVANTELNGVQNLSVTATDLTQKTTAAGAVSAGNAKAGVGGAVAYTAIGSAEDKEMLRAEVNHVDITTTESGKIEVSAADSKTDGTTTEKSRVTTVGAGVGVSWGKNSLNLQGAAAVSEINKDNRAALNNTNINAGDAAKHPTIDVAADTKSKINTMGAVGDISVGNFAAGTVGLAINRMNQDTMAEMATDDGKITKSNVGFTQVRATGNSDIHSAGVGGTVAVNGTVSFAGSGSYNYIDNDVDAIIKNQDLTSNGSVGAVARSDDRLYNFAGGFAIGANTKAALGAAVAINEITGSTNALVKGGSLAASGTGNITVTRPQDDILFTTKNIDLSTDREKLSESRTEEEKSGIVVDSSATHTIISQMASGGVAASSNAGVGLAGTVNLNTVKGKTTAKIQDAALNSSDQYSDVNVNAIDYTNLGSFTGTASVGAAGTAGVSLGVSANWETLNRTTAAEISAAEKKNVYAKNLAVYAASKHGSSALAFAVAVGLGGDAGVASGDSIVRRENTSEISAKLDNVNAFFDGSAEINASHLGNSNTMNIGGSVSGGYGTAAAGAGVSVMDDASTVKAEVKNSDLKAKESGDGKNISVLAENENHWKNTLVTASAAVGIGAGLAANVGVNNTTGETAVLVTNSNLEAKDITVKAADTLTADSTGGVGAAGLAGVGVSVALNNVSSSVSARVTGGAIKAANNAAVAAEETRDIKSSVTGVAVGGVGAGINVAVTSINESITNAQLSNAADEDGKSMGADEVTKDEIKVHLDSVNKAKGALGASGATFYGLTASDKQNLEAAKNQETDLSVPDSAAKKQGVHAEVSGNASVASVTGGESVNLTAKETSEISAKNTEVTVGGTVAASVTDAIIHVNHGTDVTLDKAAVTGKNVNIEASQAGNGSKVDVNAVGVGSIGVGVGYAGVVNKGATDVNITDSAIESKGNLTVNANDESKGSAKIANTGVSLVKAAFTFANVENANNVGVTLAGKNKISASEGITIDAKKANALEAHTQGVGVSGADVAVNHAALEDKGTAAAKITGDNNTFGTFAAKSFYLGAANNTTGKLSAGNTTVSILGVSRMRGKGNMDLGAEVSVAGGAFNAKTVEFASLLGDANGRTLEGNVKGHNVSGVAVNPDAVVLDTDATSKVVVANSSFASDANLVLSSKSYVDRKAYISGVTVGAVAVGNTSADISGKETLTAAITGKSGKTTALNSLRVLAYGENKGKALADAGGGGLVDYVGAHVGNTSTSTVESSIGGKWDIRDNVSLSATHRDETRLTASEGHGEVMGLSGTSADNVINTTTRATVEKGADIIGNRFQASAMNSIITGSFDDIDENGNTDVRSHTLEDYFGGIISGNSLRSRLDITENSNVTIGENTKIVTSNQQEYVASSLNDLTNHVQAKGGGAAVETNAVSENKLNINNTVDVLRGATLNSEKEASKEDIILSAYDNQSLKSHADATVYAFAGYSLAAKNKTTMNRTNNINVAGTIDSGSDVGLYTGYDAHGIKSNLKADLKAGAYNYSAIPVSSPDVDYDIAADKGTVDVSGVVRSIGNINAVASGGREEIAKDESKWEWTIGGSSTDKKFLSSNAVVERESSDKMKESTVHVTGALIAGTADPINVTIKGTVTDGLKIETDNNLTNQKVKASITQGTFDYANTLSQRLDELNKLIAAYDAEEGGANDGKMEAYVLERERIQNKMAELGLTETDDKGNVVYSSSGRPVFYVDIPDIATSGGNINVQANNLTGTGELRANAAPDITITNESDAYLRLNNIIMGEQGGQIVYNDDNVIPPNILQGNAKINEINEAKGKAAFSRIYGETDGKASELLVDNTFDGNRESTVKLTPELEEEIKTNVDLTNEEKQKYIEEINNGNFKYIAITDVEVNGTINNTSGNVTIKNETALGDIHINGGTQERPTGISGANVKLMANGSIVQDYKEGIVHISGAPEEYLADTAKTMQENLQGEFGFSETAESNATELQEYSRNGSNEPTGYITGSDIYVSAANINVNGLIQSGYKTYAATVTKEQLAVAQQSPADRAAIVQNRTMYKVNDGGIKWSSEDNAFYYEAQVYWDHSTNNLVVEDIDTTGGKVYLTGRIASTDGIFEDPMGPIIVHGQVINDSGNSGSAYGRIFVADGAANIILKNETSLDMNVGKVLNNQREGVITIADTAKNTWTEYKRGQTRYIADYANYLREHSNVEGDIYKDAEVSVNGLSYDNLLKYAVKEGQVYTWVNGKNVKSTKTYENTKKYAAWGLIKTSSNEELVALEQESEVIDESDRKDMGLPEGAVLTTEEVTNPDGGISALVMPGHLTLHGSTKVLSQRIYDKETYTKKSGFLGWNKKKVTRWKDDATTLVLYNYLMNASENIGIGLLGDEKGSITIDSIGNVNLTGNVANSHNEATLSICSDKGGISQSGNTTLRSEIVDLKAHDDIKGIHIASLGSENNGILADNIKLSAVSTGKGNIDITAVGGVLGDEILPGNVEIVALKSQDSSNAFSKDTTLGNVALNAEGNIIQSGSDVAVEGWNINLTSKNGSIGTEEQSIQIASSDSVTSKDRYGAQINADANGDIYLAEAAAGGDMRVGKIVSREGDVNLTVADGSFIDAHSDTSLSSESVDSKVRHWIDAGLIDGERDAEGNYTYKGAYITGLEKKRDDYKANVELAYMGKTKDQWAAEYVEQKAAVEKVYASADYQNYKAGTGAYAGLTDALKAEKLAKDGHKNYVAYAQYDNADAYLEKTAAYKYSQYANAEDYLANDDTYKSLADKADNPTFEWTKEMMLYAVSEKLVNKDSGDSDQTDREASVFGKNINLNAAKGIGTFDSQPTTITVEDLSGADSVAYMKQLTNADAADVTVKRDKNGNIESFMIMGNMPLGVNLQEGGILNVQAGGTVSVAGRTNTKGESSAINVGTIDATQNGATGDVRLFSEKGIYDALNSDQANITGNNLILIGGVESIGTSAKPLDVSLSGDLIEARADENVFIRNVKNDDFLRLGAMFAGDTISLNSEKGFKMSDANTNIADSYINAGKKLEFKANTETGIVGDAGHAIRILNDRADVNIAAGSAHIKGMGSLAEDIQNGTLVLGDVNIKHDFAVESEGKIAQSDTGKIVADNVMVKSGESLILENTGNQFNTITVDGIETKTGEKLGISGDVRIQDNADALTVAFNRDVTGAVSVKNRGDLAQAQDTTIKAGKDVTLTSTEGSVAQGTDAGIQANTVTAVSAKDVNLQGAKNAFDALTVQSSDANAPLQGSVSVLDKADKLELSVQPIVNGDIAAENTKANGVLHVVSEELRANGDETGGVKGSISLKSDGSLQTDAKLTAANDVKAASSNDAMIVGGDVSASNNIELQSKESLQTNGKLTAIQGEIALTSDAGNVAVKEEAKAKTDVTMSAKAGSVAVDGAVTSTAGDVIANAMGAVATKDVTANQNVKLTSKEGDITTGAAVTAEAGKVEATAQSDITAEGAVNAGSDVTLLSKGGTIATNDTVTAVAGSINVTANGDVTSKAKLSAEKGAITLTSDAGNVAVKEAKAKTDVTFKAEKGSIVIDGAVTSTAGDLIANAMGAVATKDVTANQNVKLTSKEGDITTGAAVTAEAGKVEATAQSDITAEGAVKAGSDVTLLSKGGLITTNNAVTAVAGNIDATAQGNVTTNDKLSAVQGAITLTSDAGNIAVNGETIANEDVTLHAKSGSVAIEDAATSTEGDVKATAKEAVTITADVTAKQNVALTSENADIKQSATAGIQAQTVTAVSAKGVELQGKGNQFATITVQSFDANAGIQGSVLVQDSADNLNLSIESAVNGNITVENKKSQGTLHAIKELQANGDGADAKGDITLQSDGSLQTDSRLTATNDVKAASTNGAMTVSDDVSASNNIELQSKETLQTNGKLTAIQGEIALTSEAGNVAAKEETTAKADVILNAKEGSVAIDGTVTSTEGNVKATAKEAVTIAADVTAKQNVALTSENADIKQSATAGIQTQTVTAVSAKDVNLQGAKNAFDALTVQSSDANAPLQGSVSVLDKADKLELSVQPIVNGDIAAENTKANGVLHVVSEELRANGDETGGVKGSISLKSDGSLQTDAKLTAADDVNLTSVSGDVSIDGDISTGDKALDDLRNFDPSAQNFNSLTIKAGGAVNEAAGVKIETPVVATYTGKGVSLESEKNVFSIFVADASRDGGVIGGSVKATTNYHDDDRADFIAGVKAPIQGDIELSNIARKGGLDFLSMDEGAIIDVRGGNGAQGNMVLTADGNVGLLGNTKAAHDIVIDSANGSFSGIGRSMEAGYDVLVSAGDAVTYIGTVSAGNDMDIRVTNPSSDGRGIRIGELSENETLLAAGNEARFYVKGDGDIHFAGDVIAEKGDVIADITGTGGINIYNSVQSENASVSLETGTGNIRIGKDITAGKDVVVSSRQGNITVGHTETGDDGDILSKAGNVSIQTGEGVVGIVKSVKAQEGSIDIQVGTGGVAIGNNGPGVETVSAYKNIDVAVDLGRIEINGKTSTKKGDISMSAAESEYVPGGQNIIIAQNGELDSGRDARLTGRNGDLHVTDAVKAVRNLNAKVLDEGDIVYDKTVTVNGDVTAKTDKGSISVAKEVTGNLVALDTGKGNITVSGDIRSNTDVTMHTGTGDISVKNVNAQGNTTISDTGRGNVNGKNIVSGGTTHVSLTKGDLFLNLAEGKAVVLRMEDNTKASTVGTVLADSSGGAGPDVELTGNYIPIGTLAAKNGNAVFEVTAMGANNQKLISGEITVGSLRSRTNTHMPTLWANRGNIHVDEGDLAIDDVLAVDKIHLENKLTDLAIFGRTPTRDGEQLYYWNNLEMANSKTRPFTLYANGKVRTHRAVLIDAGRYYGKLYGDNLSVVDMMRERLTNEHGQYTFDRTWYTKPGEVLREKVLFGMDTVDEDIRRHNASSGQLM